MSTSFADLVEELTEEVPARDGVPSAEAYERMVKEAARDFGRRCGKIKRATLSITPGTATYDLEADFLKLIKLISLVSGGGVIHSAAGLIPVNEDFCEEWTIDDGQITFYPTPTYTLTREYKYKGGWLLTEGSGGSYETMGEEEAGIVMKKAKALALDSLWRSNAGTNFKFQIGDESYDMTDTGNDLKKSRDGAEAEYVAACELYNGNTGRMM